jgi:hypothetical protein
MSYNAALYRRAPERNRTTTWPVFIRTHLALLAGTDFFTTEVLTLRGLVTYYVLFFIPFGQKIGTAEEPVLHQAIELAGAQSWGDG